MDICGLIDDGDLYQSQLIDHSDPKGSDPLLTKGKP